MKLVTVAEMQVVEREANANGLTYELMMENAGKGLAEVVDEVYAAEKNGGAFGLVGSGNNGGDTLVALAILAERGWKATAYIVRSRPMDDRLMKRLSSSGGNIFTLESDSAYSELLRQLGNHAVILDGILGTGIRLPLRGEIAEALNHTHQAILTLSPRPKVVAVDCPSGVDCDSGEADSTCLVADLTVTMAAVKTGLLRFPAVNLVGELRVVGIGLEGVRAPLPTWEGIKRRVAEPEKVKATLPKRSKDSHKGSFGTALVVAGSINYTGAAILAGKAAYRIGAGLVTLAVPEPLYSALAGHFPEATWVILPDEMGVISGEAAQVLLENLERPTAMLIGPGIGLEDVTREFLNRLFRTAVSGKRASIGFVSAAPRESQTEVVKLPGLVIDADGLKLLARLQDWVTRIPAHTVLTPHPGEMAILSGLSVNQIQTDRIGIAEKYAQAWGHVLVLKGANTVVASPDGRTTVIPVASPALARAGTGDVLAGTILGLRAQGMAAYEAAVAGAWIHAQCGLQVSKTLGTTASVLAGDLLGAIPVVLSQLGY